MTHTNEEYEKLLEETKRLEFIAKAHHDTIVRIQKLAESYEPYGNMTFYGNVFINEIRNALEGDK